ncbi:hypothetical protein [Endozoicomonas sp. 8E]|uniref:hypothetical protein n=1 Tax=Endozoicomonas sp. 8E TaxID=3035692 RepID=UPI002938EE4C|nr:hypothetical protein [Endozoicomonas sp. 8E]WOG29010.1 hypothetical protein P6910_04925 [Endozoicomonas sp. 8E]
MQTRRFIVEFKQNASFPKQSFSIKPGLLSQSVNPSDISDTNGCTGSDSPPDEKRHKLVSYELKKDLVELISWQLLYATQLLVAYELILNTNHAPVCSKRYSWLPVRVVVAVGWLVRSYWNPDSSLFNPIEQHEATSMLTQGDIPFVTVTAVFGSGHNQQQYSPSASHGQQSPGTTTCPASSFTSFLYSEFGDGNREPQEHLHTFGLNCFVHPCQGFCRLRSSSDSRRPAEWLLNTVELSTGQTGEANTDYNGPPNGDLPIPRRWPANADDLIIISGLLNLGRQSLHEKNGMPSTLNHFRPPMEASETQQTKTESSQWVQGPRCLSQAVRIQTKDQSDQETCDVTMVREDGQPRLRGKTRKNAQALSYHKRKDDMGQKICEVSVIGEDNQSRPCGMVCKNRQALCYHRIRDHSGKQTCDAAMVGEDGQLRTCGTVCNNRIALSEHRRRSHSGQRTCEVTVVGEDGQPRPCGMVYRNVLALSAHKSGYHRGQSICNLAVVGEDGQPRPCGKTCKNAKALSNHKSIFHGRQQTCKVSVIGESGQPRPCGKDFKSVQVLSHHKRLSHSGQQACTVTLFTEGGQQRPCGKVFKNARALLNHNRIHRKRKLVDVDQSGDFSP